jgi:hypothetical protein
MHREKAVKPLSVLILLVYFPKQTILELPVTIYLPILPAIQTVERISKIFPPVQFLAIS